MSPVQIITWLTVGIIIGWLGGALIKKRGFGVTGDIIVGIVGGFLGNLIFSTTFETGIKGYAIAALIGSVILILFFKIIKKA
ncbi:MAG: GlsB/YeaQ/YmgE family stress response membrane protein [Candidatus Aminicenantia bacterium]